MVVHVSTRVITTLGRLDDDKNIVDQQPLEFTLRAPTAAAFNEIQAVIAAKRAEWENALAKTETQPKA